jgi:hypothetical protein
VLLCHRIGSLRRGTNIVQENNVKFVVLAEDMSPQTCASPEYPIVLKLLVGACHF